MLNSKDIVNFMKLLKNSNCKQSLLDKLLELGFTLEELELIADDIDSVMDFNADEDDVDEVNSEVISELTSSISSEVNSARSAEKSMILDIIHDAHEIFNAKSAISIEEPTMSETRFTSPVDIQDANYSVIENYPQSYGFIDTIKNWFKINKETHHAEFVHSSKSHLKIDKDGNATLYVTGNLKQIVEGDYSLEVRGSHDFILSGSKYEHVTGQVEEKYDSTKDEKVAGNVTETYGGNHDTNVSGNRNENAATIHHN